MSDLLPCLRPAAAPVFSRFLIPVQNLALGWYIGAMDWRRISDNLAKLPTFVKEEFGTSAAWYGLVAPAIGAVIGFFQLSPPHTLYLLAIWYILLSLLATVSRYTSLELKQKRRIEILWGRGHPFVHYGKFLDVTPIQKLWRIGISNESPVSSICDVEVKLTEMEPHVNVVIPATLHRMGDNPLTVDERYQTKTDIHPGDPLYFDVIGELDTGELLIYYADKALPQRLPILPDSQPYRLTIRVSGRDISPRARDFKAYMDEHDDFIMEPVNESYEPRF